MDTNIHELNMAVYGQKLDGQPSDERPKQLTPPSFGKDVKLGGPMPGCGMHSRLKLAE